MNSQWNAAVSNLLKKSRQLRKDMVKIITDDASGYLVADDSVDSSVGMAVDVLNGIRELKHPPNAVRKPFNIEVETVDFILDENLSFNELQAVKMLNSAAALVSSDDEEDLSESGDPLHDESIISNLFFRCENVGKHENHFENQALTTNSILAKKSLQKHVKFDAPKTKIPTATNFKKSVQPKVCKDHLPNKHQLQTSAKVIRKQKIALERAIPTPYSTSHQNLQFTIAHCLLMVPSGLGFVSSCQPSYLHAGCRERNLYLVCRMFWTNDVTRSDICWNASNPKFEFRQVAPVQITPTLLNRLRNNVMVIEVWSKSVSPIPDEIIGICKLPLHLFYLTFHDVSIANSFFRSQQPVIAVNDRLPVINLFSGVKVGQLKVLLAMGKLEQITHLQENPLVGMDENFCKMPTADENLIEHTFEVSIIALRLYLPPGSNIWGESDCHVQYLFPSQDHKNHSSDNDLYLSKYKSRTHLCESVMIIESTMIHRIVQPSSIPIHKCLLQVFPRQGLPIQVWCKYYYPIECEELVGETYLPLPKLCGLTSLKEDSLSSLETFTLSLEPCSIISTSVNHSKTIEQLGRIEFKITYRRQKLVSCKDTCHVEDVPTDVPTRDVEELVDDVPELVQPPLNEPKEIIQMPPEQLLNNEDVLEQVTSEASNRDSFSLLVTIEKGVHLPDVKPKSSGEAMSPNSCVSLSNHGTSNCLATVTKVDVSSNNPMWNWHGDVSLSLDFFQLQKHLVFEIWHIYDEHVSSEDNHFIFAEHGFVIGFASVDLSPLLVGMQNLSGWYNIIDFEGFCKGQIKIAVQPKHGLSGFQTMLFDSDVPIKDPQKGYLTAACYSDFPSHVARYTEQIINYQNFTQEANVDKFNEVPDMTKYNTNLDDVPEDSLSFLMANLREKLSNLDILQESMEHWLSHLSESNSCAEDIKNAEQEHLIPVLSDALSTGSHMMDNLAEDGFSTCEEVFLPQTINNIENLSRNEISLVKDSDIQAPIKPPKTFSKRTPIDEKYTKNHSRLAAAIFISTQDNEDSM